jgi:hypothetical protein
MCAAGRLGILAFAVGLGFAQSWIQLNPTGTAPGARAHHSVVVDPNTQTLIVFGGMYDANSLVYNDTWILKNSNGLATASWQKLATQGATPPPLWLHQAVYDSINNRMIVLGGSIGGGFSATMNVWVLTNANGSGGIPTWITLSTAGGSPTPRWTHSAVYDSANNRIIMFGGAANGCCANDVWVLTNANGLGGQATWTQLSPIGSAPAGRQGASAVYDSGTNRMMLFAGATPGILDDLWILNNANGLGGAPSWTKVSPNGAIPPARYDHGAIYDPATNRMTVFGGQGSDTPTYLNDVWVLLNANGSGGTPQWIQQHPSGTPPAERCCRLSLVYDSGSNRMTVFGGANGPTKFNDTWILTNANGISGSQLGITQLFPNHGGNAGSVTVQIIGSGFQPGSTVKLTGLDSDIIGTNTTVPNASALTTTFAHTGVRPGVRNVIVTNANGTSGTLPAAFTVEQGGAPDIGVDIIGREQIRIGREQTFYVAITNSGLVDAPAVYVNADYSGEIGTASVQTKAVTRTIAPNQIQALSADGVPALSRIVRSITLKAPQAGCSPFTSRAYVVKPDNPCGRLQAVIAATDGLLNVLYRLRLVNAIAWMNSTLSANSSSGGCFDPNNWLSRTFCDAFEGLDAHWEGYIESLETARRNTCAVAALSGCHLDCNEPPELSDLGNIAGSLKAEVESLRELYTLAQIPPEQVSQHKSNIDIFRTQALTLPNSLTFPQRPPVAPLDTLAPDVFKSIQLCTVASLDPNDKKGLVGVGTSRYIPAGGLPSYAIYFENKPTATAAAQDVIITDQLDLTRLDINTVTLGPIGFTDKLVTPASIPLVALGAYITTVDLRPANNLVVRVAATLNTTTGLLTWTFNSLDPTTGKAPEDPLAGFLPASAGGSVLFTASLKPGLSTNTQISNEATIIFDTNAPLDTPVWTNTIDATAPTSKVNQTISVAPQTSPTFPVTWSGTDIGAGVGSYTIYASDNNSPFTSWLTNTTAKSSTYTGVAGHTYRFYSIARDLVGNTEAPKTAAEATTIISPPAPTAQCTGCYFLSNNARATVAFNIGIQGLSSRFSYNYRNGAQILQFASATTSQIAVSGNTATFAGQGTLNGQTGYAYTVIAKDGGAVGSSLDTVSIQITGPNNYSYVVNGTIMGGDVVVK